MLSLPPPAALAEHWKSALAVGDSSGQRQGELEVPPLPVHGNFTLKATKSPSKEGDRMAHLGLAVGSTDEKPQ